MTKRLSILATKFRRTPEADKVFDQRGWRTVYDETVIPKVKEVIRRERKETPLIDLLIEEVEYRW